MKAEQEAGKSDLPHRRYGTKAEAAPTEEAIDLGGGVKMEFVLIRPGSFMMGTREGVPGEFADEKPAHRVRITQPFYLGKYEVTQEQWDSVMADNPSQFKGSRLPVENVSWEEAQTFLEKLEAKTGRKFALPTEAQWEYACRAGTVTRYSFGDNDANLGDYAWFGDNSEGITHPVGEKRPNGWGLYDMHGNVWEWCADGYGPYRGNNTLPPQGPPVGTLHAIRGGAWNNPANGLRSSNRNSDWRGYPRVGLRCVMEVDRATPRPGGAAFKAATNSTFGPIIERVLYCVVPTRPIKAEDLDGGRELEVPAELAKGREGEIFEWLAAQGADLLAFERGRSLALAASPTLAAVPSAMWDRPTAADLQAALKSIPLGLERVESDAKEGFIAYRLETNATFPLTFAFETKAGGIGVLQIAGLTESPRGVKIRYRLVQQRGRQKAEAKLSETAARKFTFGPVIERVVYDISTGSNCFLNFETQDMSSPNEKFINAEAMRVWAERHGYDLVADDSGRPAGRRGLTFLGGFATTADSWDRATVESVVKTAQEAEAKLAGIPNRLPLSRISVQTNSTGTFVFETRRGWRGLLQITGFTESPRGVKVRYRLAYPAVPKQSSIGGNPRAEASRGPAKDPQMRADIEKDIPLVEGLQRVNQQFPSAQPLTEEEVVAAVRNIKQAHPDIPEAFYTTYQRIVKERVLPKGMYFSHISGWDTDLGHFDVDWRDLTLITLPVGSKGPCFNLRIRARFVSSETR